MAIAIICFILAGITLAHTPKHTPKKQTAQTIIIPQQKQPTPASATEQTQTVMIKQPIATPTFVIPTNTSMPQPTNTPAPISTVTIQITEPDGIFNFSVAITGNTNPCSILNSAKDEGKIHSVTIQHYDAPLNSDYVKELNGYSNNWTFKLNGDQKPTGCSNYNLNKGDTVTWQYN